MGMTDDEFYIEVCNRLLKARDDLFKVTKRRIAAEAREKICKAAIAHWQGQLEVAKYRDSIGQKVA